MTLDELIRFDVSAAWAGLAPDRQAAIGEAVIAWQLAQLTAETTIAFDEIGKAEAMADEAREAAIDAVEAALPTIDWSDAPAAPRSSSNP